MTLYALNWIVGLGLTGIVIAMVLLFFFGQAAFWAFVGLAKAILGTRVGLAICVGLACLYGGLLYGDREGRSEERAKCEAAQLRAEQEAAQRDKSQGERAAEDAKKRLALLEAANEADQRTIDEYRKALADAKPGTCTIDRL